MQLAYSPVRGPHVAAGRAPAQRDATASYLEYPDITPLVGLAAASGASGAAATRLSTAQAYATAGSSSSSSSALAMAAMAAAADRNFAADDHDSELTPEFLRAVTGFSDLSLVSEAELTVDSASQSVSMLSALLPNVLHLNLSRSRVASLRDLGTGFTSLRVLWLSASGLGSVAGAHCIGEHLCELYLAFNSVRDVAPLSGLAALQVLDLEGNLVTDGEAAAAALVSPHLPALRVLTLTGNPFLNTGGPAAQAAHRRRVIERVDACNALLGDANEAPPRIALEVLDDVPIAEIRAQLAATQHVVDSDHDADADAAAETASDDGVALELQLLHAAIRTQLGRHTGECAVAGDALRTTSRLMSRQRSLAPDEQRNRVRTATAASAAVMTTATTTTSATASGALLDARP